MATTQELFAHVQESFGIVLEEDERWSSVAKVIDLHLTAHNAITLFFAMVSPARVRQEPQLFEFLDVLFRPFMLNKLKSTQYSDINVAAALIERWTFGGTKEISQETANALEEPLRDLFVKHKKHHASILRIVYYSPVLWSLLGPMIVDSVANNAMPTSVLPWFQYIFHRHIPERLDLYPNANLEKLYYSMCNITSYSKPTLLEMRNILNGPHNNALAWHTALSVCAPEDPTIVGSWMKMSETFSSLRLDPADQDAWKFWHLLRECLKDDASGQELLTFLANAKCEMFQAFKSIWPIVDAFYDQHERYEKAALTYTSQDLSLALPTMFPQEHMLEEHHGYNPRII